MKSFENESTEERSTSAGSDSPDSGKIVGKEDHPVSASDVSTEPVSVAAEQSVPEEGVSALDGADVDQTISHAGETVRDAAPLAADDGNVSAAPALVEAEQDEDDETDAEADASVEPSRRWWQASSRSAFWIGVAFWAVIILGALLRFWNLGARPLHHDESLHAYFSMMLLHNNVYNWQSCFVGASSACYRYDPLTHGPFQFHIIALVYQISLWLGAADHGINTTTVRIAAATLGSAMVALPYLLRDYLGKMGAWLSCFLLAVSPGLVYYSRFAREDIYMAFFTVLLVVATARYVRSRKMGWLITAALAFTLSYATKESTFLLIGLFGIFFGALLVWELGIRWIPGWSRPSSVKDEADSQTDDEVSGEADVVEEGKDITPVTVSSHVSEESKDGWRRFLPRTAAPWLTLLYFVIVGIFAKWVLGLVSSLSISITSSTVNLNKANVIVSQLKQTTQLILPWLGIALVILVVYLLLRDQFGKVQQRRHGWAARVDPQRQPLLDTILTMPWTHWFFALVLSWFLFMLLFTVLFTNISTGIGDGIWQGLYYWLQQQQVARGGQPWYYYLLLIPLYEQIGVVFGLAGVIYALFRPTRLRLFLAYWFVGNLVIYSWAGEKMPWLMIHITIPMLLLAALALQPAASVLWRTIQQRFSWAATVEKSEDVVAAPSMTETAGKIQRKSRPALWSSALIVLAALLLLVPTLQNMYQVNFVHAADAPHEMMIYVQTSTDINTVMAKIDQIDQKLYHGDHSLPIGVTSDTTWPFAWYLRDYTNVCYQYPTGCETTAKTYQVILGSGDELSTMQQQYGLTYQYHQYHMRTQWDQGYMPPLCVKSATNSCSAPQPYVGVGPWLWLSYGDNPPQGATFNLGKAVSNIWQWWWERKAFGDVNGSYDMGLFVSNQVVSTTGVTP